MSELPARRSALTTVYRPGRYGEHHQQPGVRVRERRGLEIVQVAAYADTAKSVATVIAELTGLTPATENSRAVVRDDTAILWMGPHRWWVVLPDGRDLCTALTRRLDDAAAVTSQGHGRVALRLAGSRVRDLLAGGSAVDFHPDQFIVGWCRPTQLAGMGVTLHCMDDTPTVDLYVPRSYAVSFWEWLMEAGLAAGLVVEEI